jgi:hypothetical protein
MRSNGLKIAVVVALVALLWLGRLALDYFDANSPAHLSMQVQLKLFGEAMYEFHANTGRWPNNLEDLAKTSLPAKSYVWRQTANAIVFLWPQNLKPDQNDNANVLLAYWHGGWFNRLGRVWVCWGDLRTEHMPERELRAQLKQAAMNK